MKNLCSAVLHDYDQDELVDSLVRYMRAGWRPFGDPMIGLDEYVDSEGNKKRRLEYFQRIIRRP